jgi:hypothetical protein
MADELLTRAELLTYCPGLTSVANATLDAYIDSASRIVEDYCHREFASKAVSERHPYRFSPNVILNRTPVTEVSNVTLYVRSEPTANIGNVTNDYPSNMTANSTGAVLGYVVRPNSGVMTVDPYSFRVSSEQIQAQYFYEVNYTGGYANIPTPVKLATAKIVDTLVTQWGVNSDIVSEKIGDYSYTKTPFRALVSPSNDVGMLLGPYVKVGVNGV